VAFGSIELEERPGSELAMRDESTEGRKPKPRKRSRARTPRPKARRVVPNHCRCSMNTLRVSDMRCYTNPTVSCYEFGLKKKWND
jgi:hypothetical protein